MHSVHGPHVYQEQLRLGLFEIEDLVADADARGGVQLHGRAFEHGCLGVSRVDRGAIAAWLRETVRVGSIRRTDFAPAGMSCEGRRPISTPMSTRIVCPVISLVMR